MIQPFLAEVIDNKSFCAIPSPPRQSGRTRKHYLTTKRAAAGVRYGYLAK